MSVQDGQNVNAAITNAALMSRLNDTSTIGKVDILNNTESTLPTNGALNVSGGVGIEKSLNVAIDANIDGNLSVDGSSTLSAITATTLNATGNIITTAAVQGDDLIATDSVSTNVLTTTGQADVGGVLNVTGDTNLSTVSSTGLADFNSLDVDTSATIGTTLGVTGNTTLSTLSTTGLATLHSAQVTNNLVVTGDLTVNGTTTTVNSSVVDITDQNLTLNNLGSDATSEGAGLTIDRTGTSGSLIYKDASASKFAAGPLGSEIDLVNVSGSQTLTNKTISGASNTLSNIGVGALTGTLPIANGGTGQTTANAALNAFLPVQTGNANRVLGTDGTNTSWVIGGGGGGGGAGYNIIQNGDYENGIQIFTPYNDSSTTRPIDGTGGTATVTAGFLLSPAIRGSGSFVLSKPASNCQGQGWAIANTTIEPEFKAKPLQFTMSYRNNNANFVAGSNGSSPTDGDFIVTFYDLTNNKIVEGSNIKFFSNSQTLVDTFSCTVQFDSNIFQVRPIVHVASTSALAIDFIVDNVSLSPQLVNQGALITEWVSYTPTIGLTTNVTNINGRYRLVGDSIQVQARFELIGTPAAGTSTVSLPPGFSIDTAKLPAGTGTVNNGNSTMFGSGIWEDAGVGYASLGVAYSSTTVIQIFDTDVKGPTDLNAAKLANGDAVGISFQVPILGQSGSVKMSEPGDGRHIFARARRTGSGQLVPHNTATKVAFNGKTTDFGGNFDTTLNRFQVQSAGVYTISGNITYEATTASVTAVRAMLYKNGVDAAQWAYGSKPSASLAATAVNFTFKDEFKAGEFIEIWTVQENTSSSAYNILSDATITGGSNVTFEKSDGSQQIGAGENISARYTSTAGNAVGVANAVVNMVTKDYDTHGAYNTSTGVFTCPIAGEYEVAGRITATVNLSTSQSIRAYVYKNGSSFAEIGRNLGTGVNATNGCGGSSRVRCVAGDTLSFFAVSEVATTLITSSGFNWIHFAKIGN